METRFDYFKSITEKLLNPTVETKEHYIFLLGTSVTYTHRPESPEKCYFRGETFSYAAQVTSKILGEEFEVNRNDEDYRNHHPDNYKAETEDQIKQKELQQKIDYRNAQALNTNSVYYAHPYQSASVDVINGADLMGNEAGHRIAKGLLVALAAIAQGKTNLKISGFSRGAVESIVLTHELARVKKMLEEDLMKPEKERCSLGEIICNSDSVPGYFTLRNKNSYTSDSLSKLVDIRKQNQDEELKLILLERMRALDVNLFALDPVPGHDSNLVGKVIDWEEKKYFYEEQPEFVTKKQVFLQKHETSYCFKPILPKDMPYEVIPGCHGTADGNQRDHNNTNIPEITIKKKKSKTESKEKRARVAHAQNLVLHRWFDSAFPHVELNEKIELGHPELDKVSNKYFQNVSERNQILLKYYDNILINMPAYEHLNTCSYTGLGSYGAIRQVFYHSPAPAAITELDAHGNGKHFINREHAKLYLESIIGKFDFYNLSAYEQLLWMKTRIDKVFEKKPLQPMINPDLESSYVEDSNNKYVFVKLLEMPKIARSSLSIMISNLAQSYLRNHFPNKEVRDEFKSTFVNTFNAIEEAANSVNVEGFAKQQAFARDLSELVHHDMTRTLLEHQDSLFYLLHDNLSQEEILMNGKRNFLNEDEIAEYEKNKMTHLINMQNLDASLEMLVTQIEEFSPYCNEDILKANWNEALRGSIRKSENDFQVLLMHMKNHISHKRKLLKTSSSEVLATIDAALTKKPAEMTDEFYGKIFPVANIKRREDQVANMSSELERTKELLAKLQAEKLAAENAKLEKQERKRQAILEAQRLEEQRQEAQRQEEQRIQEMKETSTLFSRTRYARIITMVKKTFDAFVADYINESRLDNSGFFGFLSLHRQNGRDEATTHAQNFVLADLESILDIKQYIQNTVVNQAATLNGAYRKKSFKTYLLAYYQYINEVVDIETANINVRAYMSKYVQDLEDNDINIEELYNRTFSQNELIKLRT